MGQNSFSSEGVMTTGLLEKKNKNWRAKLCEVIVNKMILIRGK